MKKIEIYDLDGTIINSAHRYRTDESGERIDLEYWIANNTPSGVAKDELLPLARQAMTSILNPETYVIFATARACIAGDATYKFIKDMLYIPNMFIHRGINNDDRGGAELKIAGIKPLLNLKQFSGLPVYIYEDNKNYLSKMCQALGARGTYVESEQGH